METFTDRLDKVVTQSKHTIGEDGRVVMNPQVAIDIINGIENGEVEYVGMEDLGHQGQEVLPSRFVGPLIDAVLPQMVASVEDQKEDIKSSMVAAMALVLGMYMQQGASKVATTTPPSPVKLPSGNIEGLSAFLDSSQENINDIIAEARDMIAREYSGLTTVISSIASGITERLSKAGAAGNSPVSFTTPEDMGNAIIDAQVILFAYLHYLMKRQQTSLYDEALDEILGDKE